MLVVIGLDFKVILIDEKLLGRLSLLTFVKKGA